MSADLINLRQARKLRARKAKEAQAAENRIRFGRTKAERTQTTAVEDIERRRHASHELDNDGSRDD